MALRYVTWFWGVAICFFKSYPSDLSPFPAEEMVTGAGEFGGRAVNVPRPPCVQTGAQEPRRPPPNPALGTEGRLL